MTDDAEIIKNEFEENLNSIKKQDNEKNMLLTVSLCTIAVILFIAVLIGTIMSYQNYMRVKNNQQYNNASVLEL